ncbi:undecaprenyl-diphosphate phosphatase [Kineosporia mesophila]|uniref:Undecaprenyl-diphosphatase n=1 Tax=Kineosporia mesophila TaxID=566012 RepID=A0ABP6ZKE8_9ACTN|nr:undecaprenyl-diphosphate phosphatase [Kineosporia mesophila]MCD5349490.1 undecaprenyl-diphosphate phosphatase [Kineosporia mesophila]
MSSVGYLDAIVLGVVEGLTEFLPVSSTGHLTVAEGLLGLKIDDPAVTSFTAIIQFGAIVATFLYFRADFVRLALAWLRGLGPARGRHHAPDPDYRFAWLVILGSSPIVVVALVGKDLIDGPLRNLWVVAGALIAWSAVIWWAERNPRQEYEETELGVREVLIIGLMQCVALVPGVSRSGATISAGLMVGATRVAATRLSFFLAVPALTGAGVYSLKDVNTEVVGWGPMAVGTFVSFLVAYAAIAWLLKLVAGHSIAVFNPYRIVAGLAVMGMLASGVLSAT